MRKSGILMHITSLPGPWGVGSLGKCAFDFVDFLKTASQSYWQILPIGPTGFGDSPYQTYSTFAGNPYMIDLDLLAEEGLLKPEEIAAVSWCESPDKVDYGTLYTRRFPLLRRAFARFDQREKAYRDFLKAEGEWLNDYALYMALKSHFEGKSWEFWPEDIRLRAAAAVEKYSRELKAELDFHRFLQYKFFSQWKALRTYAHEQGIRIIGDVPIYVPLDSADLWVNPENFQLDEQRRPAMVAGCPPDGFTEDGQLWGNPLYDWAAMKKNGYRWWIRRLAAASRIFDVVRLDHFRGFESYWAVPAGDETARNGQWMKGPGMDLMGAVQKALPQLDFIAEDLGFLTPGVKELVEASGFPSMKILEFAFDVAVPSEYLPHNYDNNCICYTGTHDNETLVQWALGTGPEYLALAEKYLGRGQGESIPRAIIRGGLGSVAKLFVAQMQDWLELGGETRMNCPGLVDGLNWRWRALPEQLNQALAEEIGGLTKLYGRA